MQFYGDVQTIEDETKSSYRKNGLVNLHPRNPGEMCSKKAEIHLLRSRATYFELFEMSLWPLLTVTNLQLADLVPIFLSEDTSGPSRTLNPNSTPYLMLQSRHGIFRDLKRSYLSLMVYPLDSQCLANK